MLVDPASQLLVIAAARGLSAPLVHRIRAEVGRPIAGVVVQTGIPLLLNSSRSVRALAGSSFRARPNIQSSMCIPVRGTHVALGALNLNNRLPSGRFRQADLEQALPLGALAATVMELVNRNEAQSAAIRRADDHRGTLLAVRDDERRRLARELHDNALQTLADVTLRLETCRRMLGGNPGQAQRDLRTIAGALRGAIKDIRDVCQDQPPAILAGGLRQALESYALEYARHTGTPVRLQWSAETPQIRPEAEASLFRIVQEALNNVRKHAGARHVEIGVQASEGQLHVVVSDDGVGFDPLAVRRWGGGGFGLAGMRERAQLLGGRAEIAGVPGRGTTVRVSIPVRRSIDAAGFAG
jgi:signal transduction histidine kinase